MQRVVLKRVEKHFESLRYTLVIYYHKDLSIKDICNRVIKREKDLRDTEPEEVDRNEALVINHDEGVSYLIINQNTPIGVIHHETIHIAMAAFDYIKAQHTEETDELFAHTSQHIFEFIVYTMLSKLGIPTSKLLLF